jgi:hypothetical protein
LLYNDVIPLLTQEEDAPVILCCGFLPCLLLLPLPADAGSKADASRLVADALRAEVTWQAFPGFVADLEIECNGKVSQGRVVVEADGQVFVESVPDAFRLWASQHLGRIVRQRLPKADAASKTWRFVNPGTAVCRTDAPLGPCHWIRDQQFQAVETRDAKSKRRLTTLKGERNPDKKYLPSVEVLHCWDARTLELQGTETTLLTWERVGGFDLPATVQVLSADASAKPAIGRIMLTRHRLFSPTDALFTGR